MARVAFSIIVFNLDYFLRLVLEAIYPFASQILITEGPVEYYVNLGFTESTDDTVKIIKSFPDPDRKITLIQGQWREKTEMMKAQTKHVRGDTTHAWMWDADELYKEQDMRTIMRLLPEYDSVGFPPNSFFGGFDRILGGFERRAEYVRIQRWSPAGWHKHRAPTILNPDTDKPWKHYRHLGRDELVEMGIYLYHYTYVYMLQVKQKSQYVFENVSRSLTIPDYYNRVFLPWMTQPKNRLKIERQFWGVHEYLPEKRGPCYPISFKGRHPAVVAENMGILTKRWKREVDEATNLL